MTSRPRKALGGGFGWATKVDGPSQDLCFSAELITHKKRIEAARILEHLGHSERMIGGGVVSVTQKFLNVHLLKKTRMGAPFT